jgi:hypothetical protein
LLPALVEAYLASNFQQGSEPREGDVETWWKGRGWSRQRRRGVKGGDTKEGSDGAASTWRDTTMAPREAAV